MWGEHRRLGLSWLKRKRADDLRSTYIYSERPHERKYTCMLMVKLRGSATIIIEPNTLHRKPEPHLCSTEDDRRLDRNDSGLSRDEVAVVLFEDST